MELSSKGAYDLYEHLITFRNNGLLERIANREQRRLHESKLRRAISEAGFPPDVNPTTVEHETKREIIASKDYIERMFNQRYGRQMSNQDDLDRYANNRSILYEFFADYYEYFIRENIVIMENVDQYYASNEDYEFADLAEQIENLVRASPQDLKQIILDQDSKVFPKIDNLITKGYIPESDRKIAYFEVINITLLRSSESVAAQLYDERLLVGKTRDYLKSNDFYYRLASMGDFDYDLKYTVSEHDSAIAFAQELAESLDAQDIRVDLNRLDNFAMNTVEIQSEVDQVITKILNQMGVDDDVIQLIIDQHKDTFFVDLEPPKNVNHILDTLRQLVIDLTIKNRNELFHFKESDDFCDALIASGHVTVDTESVGNCYTFIMQVENSEIHDVIASCESAYDTGHALSKDDVSRLLGAIYNRVYDSDNMLTTLWDSEPDGLIETLDTCIRESGYFDLIYDDYIQLETLLDYDIDINTSGIKNDAQWIDIAMMVHGDELNTESGVESVIDNSSKLESIVMQGFMDNLVEVILTFNTTQYEIVEENPDVRVPMIKNELIVSIQNGLLSQIEHSQLPQIYEDEHFYNELQAQDLTVDDVEIVNVEL